MTKQQDGEVAQAFRKKQKHLNDFIKPAMSGPKIRNEIEEINKTWVTQITQKLVVHYQSSIDSILAHIVLLGLSNSELSNFASVALQQAKSHFGKKLQISTILKFQNYIQNCQSVVDTQTQQRKTTRNKDKTNTPHTTNNHNTTPHNSSNTAPKQSPNKTRSVRGHKDPLSNFYPCTLRFGGFIFRSLEHIYQYKKAMYHDFQHLAIQILKAPHAGIAKQLANQISASISPGWIKCRCRVMTELLYLKFRECKIFRDSLMAIPEDYHLSHPVNDSYWGVGRDGKGKDMFAALLETLYDVNHNSSATNTPHHSPPKRSSFSSFSSISPPPPLTTNNRFSPLSPSHSPSLTPPRAYSRRQSATTFSSPNTSPTSQPKGKRTKHVSPKATSYSVTSTVFRSDPKSNPKSSWSFPLLNKSLAVLGSSNLARITRSPVEDIQIVSYPGAGFRHLAGMCSKFVPKDIPGHIFLSIGLNNRNASPEKSSIKDMKSMVKQFSEKFPNSQIFIPKINYSDILPPIQRNNLDKINKAMDTITQSNVKVLEQLDVSRFNLDPTDSHNIHWTEGTANEMLKFWLSHLN